MTESIVNQSRPSHTFGPGIVLMKQMDYFGTVFICVLCNVFYCTSMAPIFANL